MAQILNQPYVLFPGRHHVLTNFQFLYLQNVVQRGTLPNLDGKELLFAKTPTIIWPITSANHQGTRRNPIAGNRREVAISHFMEALGTPYLTYLIPDVGATQRFAEYTLNSIEIQSAGQAIPTPENTVVACSTPDVINMYEQLGFAILPVELEDRTGMRYGSVRPWDVVQSIVENGENWQNHTIAIANLHQASWRVICQYGLDKVIQATHADPILTDDGDLTSTRDYNTYARSFDSGAKRKYEQVRAHIQPGRIADLGCANGGMIEEMSRDQRLAESDLYGTEITRMLYQRCHQRQANGEFGNPNTFFYHHNCVEGAAFPENSMNTILTSALTHEVYSYVGEDALRKLTTLVYQQLAPGGVYINLDVCGPNDPDELVYASYRTDNGTQYTGQKFSPDQQGEFKEYLDNLSTYGRFLQFVQDFQPEGTPIKYDLWRTAPGRQIVLLRAKDEAEFRSKMDFTDNWWSEMHEQFCFANFDWWKTLLTQAGFRLKTASHSFTNEWLIENKWKGTIDLYKNEKGNLMPLPYPASHVLLVAQKPL